MTFNMIDKSEILAFIFARGCSKGLPNKNIKMFCGEPLISYSISTALESSHIDTVYVSTDNSEIADVAAKSGAIVPFTRPTKYSGDKSPEIHAWKHAIKWYIDHHQAKPRVLVSIPDTSPLRVASDIDKCLHKFFESPGQFDAVITITEAHRNPYFNMVKYDEAGTVSLLNGQHEISRRQDAPKVYDVCTVAYVADCNHVLDADSLFDGNIGAVYIPKERSIDIDSFLDFEIAQYLYEREKNRHG